MEVSSPSSKRAAPENIEGEATKKQTIGEKPNSGRSKSQTSDKSHKRGDSEQTIGYPSGSVDGPRQKNEAEAIQEVAQPAPKRKPRRNKKQIQERGRQMTKRANEEPPAQPVIPAQPAIPVLLLPVPELPTIDLSKDDEPELVDTSKRQRRGKSKDKDESSRSSSRAASKAAASKPKAAASKAAASKASSSKVPAPKAAAPKAAASKACI
jgi:hypothetical protein